MQAHRSAPHVRSSVSSKRASPSLCTTCPVGSSYLSFALLRSYSQYTTAGLCTQILPDASLFSTTLGSSLLALIFLPSTSFSS